MAKLGYNVMAVKVTSSSTTGAFNDISDYITDFSGWITEAVLQESHAMGDSWKEELDTGLRKMPDITITTFYDDVAATGPVALFGTLSMLGAERVMKINLGSTNAYPKFDFIIKGVERLPKRNELTGFRIVCAPTGAATLVTT